jgi:predicted kinase
VGEKLYAEGVTDRVYARLSEYAESALAAGLTVIVDASFLRAAQRERFRQLAVRQQVPFVILSCHANAATLHARLEHRARTRLDPSEANRAVLAHQLATAEPLTEQEQTYTLQFDTTSLPGIDVVVDAVRERLRVLDDATGRRCDE